MSHNADFAISPLVAVLSTFHNSLVPPAAVNALAKFPGEHFVNTSALSVPYDHSPRQVRAWLGDKMSIGAESFNETVVGGPAINPSTFNPAVIQWDTGAGIGWIAVCLKPSREQDGANYTQLYATEKALDASVGPGSLNLTYPHGTSESVFQFLVSPFVQKKDITGWDDLPGVKVSIAGTVDPKMQVSYSASDAAIKYVPRVRMDHSYSC